jgi:hypothetical protein
MFRPSCAASIPSMVERFLNAARSYQTASPTMLKNTSAAEITRAPLPRVNL